MRSALIISRADAEFGYGHLSRMLTLARFLRNERGFTVSTLLLGDEKSLAFARDRGETVLFFPSWELKFAIRRTLLRELLNEKYPLHKDHPSVIIFDVYDFFDTFWGRGLFKKMFPLSSFIGLDIYHTRLRDERVERKNYQPVEFKCIINSLLSPIGMGESEQAGIRILYGTDFLILPPEIFEVAKWNYNDQLRKVTVFLGGGEVKYLLRLTRELSSSAFKEYEFQVFTGRAEAQTVPISANVHLRPLCEQTVFLRELSTSRFAIVSAGQTLYEVAHLGVPAVVIPVVPHQLSTAHKLSERGFGVCVRPRPAGFGASLKSAIQKLEDKDFLMAQSRAGMALVDGKGIYRVSEVIESLVEE